MSEPLNTLVPGNQTPPAKKGEILIQGLALGLAVSFVGHVGKSLGGKLLAHPAALFSAGVAAGYLTFKYRKEIVALGTNAAEESKNFVLGQREEFYDLLAEIKQENQTPATE